MAVHLEYRRPPSALMFMLRAMAPSRRRRHAELSATWRDHRADSAQLRSFLELTGLSAAGDLPILYPHVFGFRLIMAVLTHPSFPLSIWSALQIRNRLIQHAPIAKDATMTFETRMGERRVLEKGLEIDLETQVRVSGALAWESINTFYYRGRHGAPQSPSPHTASPSVSASQVAQWRTQSGVGWRFGGLTGDYNGVHVSDGYARSFGFPGAFHHPQLIIGQCLARLTAPASARQSLETWIKGPVPYGVDVRLNAEHGTFGLFTGEEARPAIIGKWAPQADTGKVGVNPAMRPSS